MKIVFLDRDGVINKYPGDTKYVTSIKAFRFLPKAKSALKRLSEAGYTLFIISNQAGVSKGIFTKKSLDKITAYMLEGLKREKVEIDGVYYCTHSSQEYCSCRKPEIGLIMKAFKERRLSKKMLRCSFFIGDTIRDIETAQKAGCKSILVFSGKEKPRNQLSWDRQPDFTAKDLSGAVSIILKPKNQPTTTSALRPMFIKG